jgi:phosphatidylinositol alpha-1,6-mannosyltransferase
VRALHVFPLFGPGLSNGSEYHEYMLTKKLVERGVEVDVLTTRASRCQPTTMLSMRWPASGEEPLEQVDGIRIHRFPAITPPRRLGHWMSVLTQRRWTHEQDRFGDMLKGSQGLVEYLHQRASSRPRIYDWMLLLGLGPWSPSLLARASRSVADYDVVLVGFMPFALLASISWIARRKRKPLVLLGLFHPDDPFHHHQVFYRCFARADAILAQTAYSVDLFSKLFPGSRPFQVGPGVDAPSFTQASVSGARFRSKYELGDRPLVLCVGRKEHSKRYERAIEAVERVKDPGVRLVLVGSDVDGKAVTSSRTVYLGKIPREDLLDAYDACDVLLHPSEHESFGMVFLEAWMRRKPVIGNSLCGAVASVIEEGKDGYLCSTAAEMASRIDKLLADPALARRLGEAGREKTEKHHTWDVVGDKVYSIYRELARNGAA